MEPRKHYFAKIPTIAIFIVMAMSGPLGVLLFILKGIDQKVQKEEQEAARARGDYRPAPKPAPMPKTPPFPGQDFPTAEQKSAKQWHKNIAALKAAQETGDTEKLNKYSALLYAQAQLIEGLPVDDPAAYAEAVCSLMK